MGGGETHQETDGADRVPHKGDVLEFEMDEPDAPCGIEWLAGTVLRVDLNKKNFRVVIKNNEDDKSTWNDENYSVALPTSSRVHACILLFLPSDPRTRRKRWYVMHGR